MERDYAKSLEEEIRQFQKEKERVREIIGQVGGKPTFMKKIFNVVFIVLVAIAFGLSLLAKGKAEILMLEIIVLLVSSKFIYFLYLQAKITHFQFWILSSIEWRLNEVVKKLSELSEKIDDRVQKNSNSANSES